MTIQKIDAFKCTDGTIHTRELKAVEHQKDLAYKAINGVMRKYGVSNESVHYPNLSLSLIPYMEENANDLINALKLAISGKEILGD